MNQQFKVFKKVKELIKVPKTAKILNEKVYVMMGVKEFLLDAHSLEC